MDQLNLAYKVEKMSNDDSTDAPKFHQSKQIRSLMEKGVNLGFTLEAIQEGLKRVFKSLNIDMNAFLTNQTAFDVSKLIDEEKFIELLITVSLQMDNPNASSFKSNNGNDYVDDIDLLDDMEEEYMPVNNNGMSFFENDLVNNESSESNSPSILNKMGFSKPQQLQIQLQQQQQRMFDNQNKKAQTIQKLQQEQQEYYIQSMNRINDKSNLRPIIVDSNDVALSSNANKQVFQFQRILKVVEYFEKRNHPIYVILSSWRKEQIMSSNTVAASGPTNTAPAQQQQTTNGTQSPGIAPSTTQLNIGTATPDQLALLELEKKNQVYYTPSKRVGTKRIVCDDDSYMLKLAVAKNGIIVSNDNFKRFLNHSDDFKLVIEERVLMYSFIDDTFMPAEDPLGKNGPSLDNFLRFESFANQQYMKRCPYRKKCTYGSKCKFWHPERALNQSGTQYFRSAHQSVLDGVEEQKRKLEALLQQNQIPGQHFAAQSSFESAFADSMSNARDEMVSKPKMPLQKPNMAAKSMASNMEMNRFDSSQMIRKMGLDNSGVVGKTSIVNSIKNNVNLPLFQPQQQQQMKPQPKLNDMFFGAKKMNQLPGFPASIWNDEANVNSGFSSASIDLLNVENDFSKMKNDDASSQLARFLIEKKMKELDLKQPKSQTLADSFTETVATAKSQVEQQGKSEPPKNSRDELKAKLIPMLKNLELVEKVLKDYPNESDVEKLNFLAGAYSFEF